MTLTDGFVRGMALVGFGVGAAVLLGSAPSEGSAGSTPVYEAVEVDCDADADADADTDTDADTDWPDTGGS